MLDPIQAADSLRAAGLRLTPQRRAVIEALVDNHTHPTADEVAERVGSVLPGVSKSTIYNTLHEFAQAGLVQEISTTGLLRFDPETAGHAHLVCPSCGRISDIDLGSEVLEALSKVAGVAISSVTLSAECHACTARMAAR